MLIGTLEVGGAERDIARNFPRLDRDEFEVVVIAFDHPGALAPELERQGIRVVSRRPGPHRTAQRGWPELELDDEAGPSSLAGPMIEEARRVVRAYPVLAPVRWVGHRVFSAIYVTRVTWWIARTLARERVDIVHFFLPHSYAYGMFACWLRRRRARRVMSRLSLNFYKDTQRLLSWLERNLLHRSVDIAIGNSVSIIRELVEEGVDPGRVRVLYNGIELAPFTRGDEDRERARERAGIARDAFAIVAVGNLYSHKGHRDLIEACAAAGDRLPPGWRLLIAGRDQEGNRAAYESLVAERGLGDHVQLLGACEDVPRLLFAADVFVQPSLHEGLPNAIIEAMAASLPVIGTTVGGIPEVVTVESSVEGTAPTGWLVPPADPGALSRALLEAAKDVERREAMGRNASARARADFSVERSVREYESIYREVSS